MRCQKFIESFLGESVLVINDEHNSQLRVQNPLGSAKKELTFQVSDKGLWKLLNKEPNLENMTVVELINFILTNFDIPATKDVKEELRKVANQEMYNLLVRNNEIFMVYEGDGSFKLMNASGMLLDSLHFKDGRWMHQSVGEKGINYCDHFRLFPYIEKEKNLIAGINAYLKDNQVVVSKQVMDMAAVFDNYGTSVIHYEINNNRIVIRFEGSDESYNMSFLNEIWTVICGKSEQKLTFSHTTFLADTNLRKLYLEIVCALN